MAIIGIKDEPFLNLDSLLTLNPGIHNEVLQGIAKSEPEYSYFGDNLYYQHEKDAPEIIRNLNSAEKDFINSLDSTHKKIWYLKIKYNFIPHTWGLFIRKPNVFKTRDEKYNQDLCSWTKNANNFPELVQFINTLPFCELGRVIIFIQELSKNIPIHRDGAGRQAKANEHRHDFLYIRPNESKKFFIYDEGLKQKHYINGKIAFFNDRDWHGADPTDTMTYSIRIDGRFTDEFRQTLGMDRDYLY